VFSVFHLALAHAFAFAMLSTRQLALDYCLLAAQLAAVSSGWIGWLGVGR